ncbi:MAG TPA: hypothetical protein VIU11_13995 [Nakamurella sp.]
MELELLVVPNCPNEAEAITAIQAAARQVGLGAAAVRTTVIDTDGQARGLGFAGSPTFLIDAVDPFAEPGGPIGMACRIYSDHGRPGRCS